MSAGWWTAKDTLSREAGQQGVLLVRGPGLSPGYWRASEEQQARFAGGWYRTGDLFERDEWCLPPRGREDDLFKVNGRWVVPTQVEQAICRHLPEVSEAVLVPTCRLHDGLRPTLFVTPGHPLDDNQILLAQRIDQHLAEQIPSHMLPANCMCCRPCRATKRQVGARRAAPPGRHPLSRQPSGGTGMLIQAVGVNLPHPMCVGGAAGRRTPSRPGRRDADAALAAGGS